MKDNKMKLCLPIFFFWVASLTLGRTQDLGYCPKDATEACRTSLSSALNVVTNCALDRPRVKKCAFILVETLSESDHKAPFYGNFYEKDFEIGDVEAYKKQAEDLRQYSLNAWIALHNLSKALIVNYVDANTLTEEQKREIENLVQPIFEVDEGRKFNVSDAEHRNIFIKKQLKRAKAIEWGAVKEKIVLS